MNLMIRVCLLLFFTMPAMADDPNSEMQLTRDAIKANKKLIVATNMSLGDEEGKAFWPVYEDYQSQIDKLNQRTVALIESYAKSFESMTDEKAAELLEEYLSIESDTLALKKDYIPRFEKVLSKRQVTRYYQIEEKIKSIIDYELVEQIPLLR